jgi:hypothetical protein
MSLNETTSDKGEAFNRHRHKLTMQKLLEHVIRAIPAAYHLDRVTETETMRYQKKIIGIFHSQPSP